MSLIMFLNETVDWWPSVCDCWNSLQLIHIFSAVWRMLALQRNWMRLTKSVMCYVCLSMSWTLSYSVCILVLVLVAVNVNSTL
jgi:hypothetical protein